MTFKKLKIKLWLQENKKILWLLELIFTIILVFLFGNKIKIPKIKFSSEAIGVTGTLLGAFIGGFFFVGRVSVGCKNAKQGSA